MDPKQNILSTVPADISFAAPVTPGASDLDKAKAAGPEVESGVFKEMGIAASDIADLEIFGGHRKWAEVRRAAAERNSLPFIAFNQGNRLNTWLDHNADGWVPGFFGDWVLPEGAKKGLSKRDPNFRMTPEQFKQHVTYTDNQGHSQEIPSTYFGELFDAVSQADFDQRLHRVRGELAGQASFAKQFNSNPKTTVAMTMGASLADPEDILLTAAPPAAAAKFARNAAKAKRVLAIAGAAGAGTLASDMRDAGLRGEEYNSNRGALAFGAGAILAGVAAGLMSPAQARAATKELKRADAQLPPEARLLEGPKAPATGAAAGSTTEAPALPNAQLLDPAEPLQLGGPRALEYDNIIDVDAREVHDGVVVKWAEEVTGDTLTAATPGTNLPAKNLVADELVGPAATPQIGGPKALGFSDVIDVDARLVPDPALPGAARALEAPTLELGYQKLNALGEPVVKALPAPAKVVDTAEAPVVRTADEAYKEYSQVIEAIARKEAGPVEKGSDMYADVLDELDTRAGIDWTKKDITPEDYDAAIAKLKDYEADLDARLKAFDEADDLEPVVTLRSAEDVEAAVMPSHDFTPVLKTTAVPTPAFLKGAKAVTLNLNGKKLKFESPVDRALAVLGKGKSKYDAELMGYLQKVYDDMSPEDIRQVAREHWEQHVRKEAAYAGDEATETFISRAWDRWAKPSDEPKVDLRTRTAVQKAEDALADAEDLVKTMDNIEPFLRKREALEDELIQLADAIDNTTGEARKLAKQAFKAAEKESLRMHERWVEVRTLDKASANYRVLKARRDLEDAIEEAKGDLELDEAFSTAGVDAEDARELAEALGYKNPATLLVEGNTVLPVLKAKKQLAAGAVLLAAAGTASASDGSDDSSGNSVAVLASIGLIVGAGVAVKGKFNWANVKRIVKNGSDTTGSRAGNFNGRARNSPNEAFRDIMGIAGTDHLGGKTGGDAFRELASRQLRVPFARALKESFDAWNAEQGFSLVSKVTGSRFRQFGQEVVAYRRAKGQGEWHPSVVKASEAMTQVMERALKMVADRVEHYQSKGWALDASLLEDWSKVKNDPFHTPRLFNFEEMDVLRAVHGNDAILRTIRGAMAAANPGLEAKWLDRMADGYWSTLQHLASGIQQSRLSRDDLGQLMHMLRQKGYGDQEISDFISTAGIQADEVGLPSRLKGRVLLDEGYKDAATGIRFTDILVNDLTSVADNWMNQVTSVLARADMTIHGDDLLIDGTKFDWTSRHMEGVLQQAVEADGRGGALLQQYREDLQATINNLQGRPVYNQERGALRKMLKTLMNVGSGSLGGLFPLALSSDVAGMVSHKTIRAMMQQMPGLRRLMMDAQAAKLSREYAEEINMFGGIGDEALGLPTYASERGWASGAEAASANYKTAAYKFYGFLTANAAQRRWATRMVHQRFVDMAYGKRLKDTSWLEHVKAMGIDQTDLDEVLAMVRKYATTDKNGKLQKLSLSEMMTHQPILAQKFNASVFRWTKKYGSDAFFSQTFPWTHRLLGQILGQFNGSTFAAHFNHLHYGVKNFDSEVFQNFMMGYLGGVAGYIGVTLERYGWDEKELKKRLSWQEIAKAGFYRAQFAGIIPKLADFSLSMAGQNPMFSNATSRGLDVGLIPLQTGAQAVKALGALVGTVGGSGIDQSEAKALERFMLLQGLLTMPIVNYLNQSLPKSDSK